MLSVDRGGPTAQRGRIESGSAFRKAPMVRPTRAVRKGFGLRGFDHAWLERLVGDIASELDQVAGLGVGNIGSTGISPVHPVGAGTRRGVGCVQLDTALPPKSGIALARE